MHAHFIDIKYIYFSIIQYQIQHLFVQNKHDPIHYIGSLGRGGLGRAPPGVIGLVT
jgi:hypothetical protein